MESFFPDKDITRCNHELSTAITSALVILGFFELPEDEQPDESIWGHPERLDDWFEAVKHRRKNPGQEPIVDDYSDKDFTQNELTAQYRKR